jgi:hypothetical protein
MRQKGRGTVFWARHLNRTLAGGRTATYIVRERFSERTEIRDEKTDKETENNTRVSSRAIAGTQAAIVRGPSAYLLPRHDLGVTSMETVTIAFVTLFLNLVSGPQTVEVAVTGPVAAVEIFLNGESAGVMRGEPWRVDCDFGSLRPLTLEAVAFDAEGIERARTTQLVNLPRPLVETSFQLQLGPQGQPRAARLNWESARGRNPISFQVILDGEPIEDFDPLAIPLPAGDPDTIHFLSARLEFEGGVTSHAEVSYGGFWAGETSTELTAIPVLRTKGKRRLTASDLAKSFLAGERIVPVVAVEKAPPSLVIVADRTANPVLENIQEMRLKGFAATDTPRGLSQSANNMETARRLTHFRPSSATLRMMLPFSSRPGSGRAEINLFPLTEPFALFRDGLMWLLCNLEWRPPSKARQKTTDAVAVAGLYLNHSASPRAVLLVLGTGPDRASTYSPEEVRGYLKATNVPLFVWTTSPGQHANAWGENTVVTSPGEFNKAWFSLQRHLDNQVIVWLDGSYLPNEIELSPAAREAVLAR